MGAQMTMLRTLVIQSRTVTAFAQPMKFWIPACAGMTEYSL